MGTIYIIRQQGVYWHEIVGISTDKNEAVNNCKHMASLDVDYYHAWVVTQHKIGEFINVNSEIIKDQSPCDSEIVVFSIKGRTEEQIINNEKFSYM